MSLTVAQASAVNDVLERLTGVPASDYGQPLASDERLIEAAELLAAHASRTLMAGYDARRAAEAVRQHLARTASAGTSAGVERWQADVAAAVVRRLDGDDLLVDGQEWYSEAPTGANPAGELPAPDELLLEGQPGRELRVRIRVELVEGAPA